MSDSGNTCRWALALGLVVAGCVDPAESFDGYTERVNAAKQAAGSMMMTPPPTGGMPVTQAGSGGAPTSGGAGGGAPTSGGAGGAGIGGTAGVAGEASTGGMAASAGTEATGGAQADAAVPVDPNGCGQPAPEEIAPEYVFTMSMQLTPGQAFLSRGQATAERVGDDLHIYLSLQYLAAGDRMTPVGPPYMFGPLIVDPLGNLRTEPQLYELPAEANPALCGLPLSATSNIVGKLCKPTGLDTFARFGCGTVEGTLHPPPLEQDLAAAGGIWRLEKLDGAALPAGLIGCNGEPLVEPQCW